MSVGPLEIVIVLVLALLVFGPSRLPQMGRSLGRGMREFRNATSTVRSELGLDEMEKGIADLKSSVSVDRDVNAAGASSPAAGRAPAPAAADIATTSAPAVPGAPDTAAPGTTKDEPRDGESA